MRKCLTNHPFLQIPDLTGQDADVMLRVADFVTQEEARRPDDAMNDEQWRHMLMTVGHDPLKP